MHYSSVGYACGIFPGTSTDAFLCYEKSSNKWRDLSGSVFLSEDLNPYLPAVEGRRPGLAFHTLRTGADPSFPGAILSPIDGTGKTGEFFFTYPDINGQDTMYVSSAVSDSAPPGSSGFSFTSIENGYLRKNDLSTQLFATRDVSGVKGISFNQHDNPLKDHLQFLGMVDGAWHATMRSKNDYQVMELGLCRGLQPASWCGTMNDFGYDF